MEILQQFLIGKQNAEQTGKSQQIHGQHLPVTEKKYRRPFVHLKLKPEIKFNRIDIVTHNKYHQNRNENQSHPLHSHCNIRSIRRTQGIYGKITAHHIITKPAQQKGRCLTDQHGSNIVRLMEKSGHPWAGKAHQRAHNSIAEQHDFRCQSHIQKGDFKIHMAAKNSAYRNQ